MSAEVYVLIGIAAERAGMHPQTLRLYERRGLITPRRSKGRIRLYSSADVALLRRIQSLSDEGLNLAGIERVLRLERRVAALEAKLTALRFEHRERRRADSRELVHVPPAGGTALVPRYAPVVTRIRRRPTTRTTTRGDG